MLHAIVRVRIPNPAARSPRPGARHAVRLQSAIGDKRPFRVGFDGRALASPASGVRRYVFELFAAMAAVRPEIEIVALGAPAHAELPPRAQRGPSAPSLPSNFGWSVSGLPMAASRARLDVCHAPSYTAPLWGPRPLVVTIHDVSYERHPEWYPYKRGPLRRWFYRRSALAADLVITDSSFSRDEIVAAYGISADRIRVVALGVGSPFTTRLARPARASGDYVVHVGDLHPRRNLSVALEAVLELRRRHARFAELQLVVAGVDRGSGDDLRARARSASAERAIELMPSLDDESLVVLYEGARALVYPSRYEGFGLPIIEAMACGTPVVAARAGSIPEVAGDAAILVDPDDVVTFAASIERLLTDSTCAADYAARGRARAAEFTWTRTARLTLDAYRDAIALRSFSGN